MKASSMKLTIRKTKLRNEPKWVLDYRPAGGKRVRRFFDTKPEAEREADAQRKIARQAGEGWVSLTTVERTDLITGYERLRKLQISLNELLDQWQNGKSNGNGNGETVEITLKAAGEKWIEFLQNKGCAEVHWKSSQCWVNQFGRGRELQPVHKFTDDDVLSWLAKYKSVDCTYNNHRDKLRSFFGFCHDNRFHAQLLCSAKICPKRKLDRTEQPCHLTVFQTQKTLEFCLEHPELLTYVVLATFAGIRPSEVDRLTWMAVDWEHKLVNVRLAKTGLPRQVHLHPTAFSWLQLAKELGSPIGKEFAPTAADKAKRLRPLRKHLGWRKWPVDILRHTFGSYYCQLTRSAGDTALQMGNSESICKNHYLASVTNEACAQFWGLTPDKFNR